MLLFEGCVCNSKGPRSSRNDKGAILDTCLTKLEIVVGIEGKREAEQKKVEGEKPCRQGRRAATQKTAREKEQDRRRQKEGYAEDGRRIRAE